MKKILLSCVFAFTAFSTLVFAQGTNEMNNSENPYKYRGLEYYLYLNHLIDSISDFHEAGGIFDGVHVWRKFHNNIQISLDEENTLMEYFDSIDFSLENLIAFESFLLEDEDYFNNSVILEFTSLAIWSKYFLDELSLRAAGGGSTGMGEFEICLDYCMKRKMGEMNSLELAFFIVGIPNTLAYILASCTYECLGGK